MPDRQGTDFCNRGGDINKPRIRILQSCSIFSIVDDSKKLLLMHHHMTGRIVTFREVNLAVAMRVDIRSSFLLCD